MEIDFRNRSVATITHHQTGKTFEVVCYGLAPSDISDIDKADLYRRMLCRGIDLELWRGYSVLIYPAPPVLQNPKPEPEQTYPAAPDIPWARIVPARAKKRRASPPPIMDDCMPPPAPAPDKGDGDEAY